MSNTKIWATDREEDAFDIGCRVVKWDEPQGFNLINTWKYTPTKCKDLESLRKKISQFTVHWSVTYRAKHCFNGLKARGLSANFSIDDDCDEDGFATIYQHLPINKLGWSQGRHTDGTSFNSMGPGVEMAMMPQLYDADMYDAGDRKKWDVPEHGNTVAPIHGTTLKVHTFTDAQMKSLNHLIWGFCELFPDVPSTFPRDGNNESLTTVMENPTEYSGLVTHYQLRRGKIDCCGLDFASIEGFVNYKMDRVPWE